MGISEITPPPAQINVLPLNSLFLTSISDPPHSEATSSLRCSFRIIALLKNVGEVRGEKKGLKGKEVDANKISTVAGFCCCN